MVARIDDISVDQRRLVKVMVPMIVGAILERTDKGLDDDNHAFRKYSASYAKWRRDKGLREQPPDLRVTGRMLSSIGVTKIQVTDDLVRLTIQPSGSELGKARAIEKGGRRFMGLSDADIQRLAAQLEKIGIPVKVERQST